jgi:hypothetical protein
VDDDALTTNYKVVDGVLLMVIVMYIYIYIDIYMYICVYICMYINMYTFTCIHIIVKWYRKFSCCIDGDSDGFH